MSFIWGHDKQQIHAVTPEGAPVLASHISTGDAFMYFAKKVQQFGVGHIPEEEQLQIVLQKCRVELATMEHDLLEAQTKVNEQQNDTVNPPTGVIPDLQAKLASYKAAGPRWGAEYKRLNAGGTEALQLVPVDVIGDENQQAWIKQRMIWLMNKMREAQTQIPIKEAALQRAQTFLPSLIKTRDFCQQQYMTAASNFEILQNEVPALIAENKAKQKQIQLNTAITTHQGGQLAALADPSSVVAQYSQALAHTDAQLAASETIKSQFGVHESLDDAIAHDQRNVPSMINDWIK